MQDRMLKYVFIAFCAVALIFPLLNIFYIFPQFEGLTVRLAEEKAAGLARHLSSMVVRDGVLPGPEEMGAIIDSLKESLEVETIKVYSSEGVVICSCPKGYEGDVHSDSAAWRSLSSGKVISEIRRAGDITLEGAAVEADTLETYVPIMSEEGGFVGVFEVYYDISREAGLVKGTVLRVSAVIFSLMLAAFAAMILILVRMRPGPEAPAEGAGAYLHSPLYQMAVIGASLFLAEIFVMVLMSAFPGMSWPMEALFDATWLLVLVSPVLFIFLFRPLSWLIARLRDSEAELKGLLSEKETLMRDTVARVRNNLQTVSSMLSLQARKLEDPAAREAVLTSEGRVRSMGLVYDMLIGSSMDFSGGRTSEFFNSLSVRMLRGLGVDANKVRLMLEVEDLPIDVDRIVACGLMLNELLANVARHAFPGERSGEVMVSLKEDRSSPGRAVFSVSDNGVGLPEGLDYMKGGGLGLMIVRALAGQMDGELNCDCHAGAKVSVIFEMSTR